MALYWFPIRQFFFLTVTSYSLFRFLRDFSPKKRQGIMPNHLFYEFHARQWAGTMILFSRISSQRALMWPVRHPFEAFLGASPCPPVKGCNLLREEVHNRSTTDEQVRNSSWQRKVQIPRLYNSWRFQAQFKVGRRENIPELNLIPWPDGKTSSIVEFGEWT